MQPQPTFTKPPGMFTNEMKPKNDNFNGLCQQNNFRTLVGNNTPPVLVRASRKPKKDSIINKTASPSTGPGKRTPQLLKNIQTTNTSSKTFLGHHKQISHNLSATNLRNPEGSPYVHRRKRSHTKHDLQEEQQKRLAGRQALAKFLQVKAKDNTKEQPKKYKETPSFIKKREDHSKNCLEETGIKCLQTISEERSQFLVIQTDSKVLLSMRCLNKKDLRDNKIEWDRLRLYLKTSQTSHNLLVKYFGLLGDGQKIYIFEQYLQGRTLDVCIGQMEFNESLVGPLVCSLLTAISYLQHIGQPYGPLTSDKLIYTMGIVKLKRYLLCQSTDHQDVLFDIWCIGKITYQLVTHQQLVPASLMENFKTSQQLFQSKKLAKCIEVGFKKFEQQRISRQLLQFLITTLWTVQHKQISMQAVWQLQFVRLYQEDNLWETGSEQN